MTSVAEEIQILTGYANRLDELSKLQTELLRELEPVSFLLEQALLLYEATVWKAHMNENKKLPPKGVREALGHQQVDPSVISRYTRLTNDSHRVEKEISHLKALIDARRSILSALKLELEATQ